MTFRIGQKVVCVDGKFIDPRWYRSDIRPCTGQVYTVRGFASEEYLKASDDQASPKIYLEEIVNPEVKWGFGLAELAFPMCRFRPVIENSTDTGMAVLREILDRETIKDGKPVRVS